MKITEFLELKVKYYEKLFASVKDECVDKTSILIIFTLQLDIASRRKFIMKGKVFRMQNDLSYTLLYLTL